MFGEEFHIDFIKWAFGMEDLSSLSYIPATTYWNKKHSYFMMFPSTWNLENEKCFIASIKGFYKLWSRYKNQAIEENI